MSMWRFPDKLCALCFSFRKSYVFLHFFSDGQSIRESQNLHITLPVCFKFLGLRINDFYSQNDVFRGFFLRIYDNVRIIAKFSTVFIIFSRAFSFKAVGFSSISSALPISNFSLIIENIIPRGIPHMTTAYHIGFTL